MTLLLKGNIIWITISAVAALAVISSGCAKGTSAPTPTAPLAVEVAPVEQRDVPIYSEWIGTLDGLVNADIKAEVSGYLLKQDYMEGAFVQKGQVLFEIDPRPFEAAVEEAKGRLAQANGQLSQARAQLAQAEAQVAVAEANQRRTQLDVDRYIPLAKQEAITQQDLDNATQNNLASKAQLQAAKAQVETAKAQIEASLATVQSSKASLATAELNLGFTKLTAPVPGIAGSAQEQVGALVSPSSGPVTTVSTLDPIKVYITVSEQEYLNFHRRYNTQASVDAERNQMRLDLILADGVVYPSKGTFLYADRQVNLGTGSIRVAGLFPNPGSVLRPGQYAKVRTSYWMKQGALLVPQRAVTELQGVSQVAVVGSNNQIAIRNVKPGEHIGNMWIIDEGLKPGDRVVAEGTQKVRPGMAVTPKPFAATASVAAR
jgi:membrane fusion protein (multidrug efflux system)